MFELDNGSNIEIGSYRLQNHYAWPQSPDLEKAQVANTFA